MIVSYGKYHDSSVYSPVALFLTKCHVHRLEIKLNNISQFFFNILCLNFFSQEKEVSFITQKAVSNYFKTLVSSRYRGSSVYYQYTRELTKRSVYVTKSVPLSCHYISYKN